MASMFSFDMSCVLFVFCSVQSVYTESTKELLGDFFEDVDQVVIGEIGAGDLFGDGIRG